MELDIQGICSALCDPKIATEDIVDIEDYFVSSFLRVKIKFIFCWNSAPFLTRKKILLSQNFLSFSSSLQYYIKIQEKQPT